MYIIHPAADYVGFWPLDIQISRIPQSLSFMLLSLQNFPFCYINFIFKVLQMQVRKRHTWKAVTTHDTALLDSTRCKMNSSYSPLCWMRRPALSVPSCVLVDSRVRWSEAPCRANCRWFQEWNVQHHYICDINDKKIARPRLYWVANKKSQNNVSQNHFIFRHIVTCSLFSNLLDHVILHIFPFLKKTDFPLHPKQSTTLWNYNFTSKLDKCKQCTLYGIFLK